MSSPAKELRPEELPSEAQSLLGDVLKYFKPDPIEKPQEFITHIHGTHLVRLADDIIFLESHNRSISSPSVARTMLESLFKLAVSTKNPPLAASKILLEVEWDLIQSQLPGSQSEDLAKIRKKPEYSAIGQLIQDLSRKWGLVENAYLSEKKFSTWRWAKEADMASLYASRYAELCNYSHVTVSSFLARSPAYVLAVVTLCLLEAARRIVDVASNDLPEDVKQRATSLWQLFQSYHKTGHYLQLFAQDLTGNPTPRPIAPERRFASN